MFSVFGMLVRLREGSLRAFGRSCLPFEGGWAWSTLGKVHPVVVIALSRPWSTNSFAIRTRL